MTPEAERKPLPGTAATFSLNRFIFLRPDQVCLPDAFLLQFAQQVNNLLNAGNHFGTFIQKTFRFEGIFPEHLPDLF
jgi:hypothetical protein